MSVLYKNPYLESEKLKSDSLLRTLQKSRLKNYMESPALHRLHSLCDSDTSPDVSEDKVIPRVKLNFDDSDCEDDVGKTLRNNEKITSKYFKNITRSNKKPELESKSVGNESDRENLEDFSFLGQSLEERIRKKMNGIKDICKGKAKERKNSCDKTPLTNGRGVDSKETNKKTSSSTKEIAEKTDKNRKLSTASNSSSDDAWELEISKIVHESKPINGKYSFLASLSGNFNHTWLINNIS